MIFQPKLSEDQVRQIAAEIDEGKSLILIAKEYKISYSTVRRIKNKEGRYKKILEETNEALNKETTQDNSSEQDNSFLTINIEKKEDLENMIGNDINFQIDNYSIKLIIERI